MIYTCSVPALLYRNICSPLGPLLAGVVEHGERSCRPDGVCLLEFGDADRRARGLCELETHFQAGFIADAVVGGSRLLDQLESELDAYFSGELTDFTLALCTPGTAFQHRVWKAMRHIPYGKTITYGSLARRIGRTSSASRAVGAASGRNRVAIVIPCHRVVDAAYNPLEGGAKGLRGYGGGIENKQWLLNHERCTSGNAELFDRTPLRKQP